MTTENLASIKLARKLLEFWNLDYMPMQFESTIPGGTFALHSSDIEKIASELSLEGHLKATVSALHNNCFINAPSNNYVDIPIMGNMKTIGIDWVNNYSDAAYKQIFEKSDYVDLVKVEDFMPAVDQCNKEAIIIDSRVN